MLPENIVQLALKSRKEGLTAGERGFLNQWLLENVELQEECGPEIGIRAFGRFVHVGSKKRCLGKYHE